MKSNAVVRSPATARRHAVMLLSRRSGLAPAKRASRKRINDVWSNSCELTQPPFGHGEITIIGTRIPNPYGALTWSASPGKISFVVGMLESPGAPAKGGVGGTM